MRWKWLALALVVVLVLVVAGGLWLLRDRGTDVDAAPGLTVTASGSEGTPVDGSQQFTVAGDTSVRISVSRLSAGALSLVPGPDSLLPEAVRFPPYQATGDYPRAVLSLTPTSGTALAPGSSAFSYGAVIRIDPTTTSGRAEDNGDNVFQRGLSSEPDLFKLEMDHDRPACTVRGSAGTVVVRAPPIARGTWWSLTCRRAGDRLTITAEPYAGDDSGTTAAPETATRSGAIGTLTFAADRPASVGGKLLPTSDILRTASDQFNGAIARVWTRPS